MYLRKLILLSICAITFFACTPEAEYEVIAKEYLEAGYAGNLDKAKSLSIPEAAAYFDFMKTIYEQSPQMLALNKAASCHVVKSELSEDKKKAQVVVEENNIYSGNLFSQSAPKLVETQETVINLEKRAGKWLVVINQ